MVQADHDPLTGAQRSDIFIHPEDANQLGIKEGDAIKVISEVGEMTGTCTMMNMKQRNIQVHWPEGNVLLKRGATDPLCGIPDYTAIVKVIPAN